MAEQETKLMNCLVLEFNPRVFNFAVNILTKLYSEYMMKRTHRILEYNKSLKTKHRVLWFRAPKSVTNQILEELHQRNIFPRIIRNSYLRNKKFNFKQPLFLGV